MTRAEKRRRKAIVLKYRDELPPWNWDASTPLMVAGVVMIILLLSALAVLSVVNVALDRMFR